MPAGRVSYSAPMRRFNTEGPVRPDDHYVIPPLERMDLDRVLGLVRDKRYFVLHAPRQTGKTSALLALRDLLNRGAAGDLHCVYVNVETAQALREDVEGAMREIVGHLASRARASGDGFLYEAWPAIFAAFGTGALREALTRWSEASPRPLVVLIDEIDALVGDTLVSALRQLRAGYDARPEGFPQSVVLCGVRDVRDYRIRSGAGAVVTGGSAFNVKAESLRLGDFTEAETRALLAQHTAETGQDFTAAAVEAVWRQTRGQPWLVNALCQRACYRSPSGRDPSRPITEADIFHAQEQLILARETHLDQLADKLGEERVRRVVGPLLRGDDEDDEQLAATNLEHARDIEYVRDLGLIAARPPLRIANPIYAEVVPRELSWAVQERLVQDAAWYVKPDGGLDVEKLLGAFQTFFREHSEHWLGRFRLSRGRPATAVAGVPATGGQRRRAHRAGIRPGVRAHGPVDRVARGRILRRGRRGQDGRGVQGAPCAAQPRDDHRAGPGADCPLHGPLRVAGRPPDRLRPEPRQVLGREAVPPRGRGDGRRIVVWGM